MKALLLIMNTKLFDTQQSQLLKKALEVYDKRHNAIARNVANANNPDYQRVNTDFSQLLNSATERSNMKYTRANHISSDRLHRGGTSKSDDKQSGKVDLAREMTEMAENQIKYEFVARMLNRHYRGLSTSITGRNR